MARTITSRKDRTCGWCQELISDGSLMKWHMQIGGIQAVHPDCEDLAFTHDREMSMKRHPAKEKTP